MRLHLTKHKWKAIRAFVLRSLRPADFLAAFIVVLVQVLVTVSAYSQSSNQGNLRIVHGSEEWLYSLDKDRIVQPLEEQGTCVIQISQRSASVISSDCPQKICIGMGSIPESGAWIACLPHGIFLSASGNIDSATKETDVGAY